MDRGGVRKHVDCSALRLVSSVGVPEVPGSLSLGRQEHLVPFELDDQTQQRAAADLPYWPSPRPLSDGPAAKYYTASSSEICPPLTEVFVYIRI
jgi:hypothetical protein